ncbi:hypothetical protein [Bacteroides zhangwenhongii]|uniref:hypothetical protein n=1 Tax=Bacteroides zhangwenhongii TaxID=2650157 RepID=UPI0022E061AA|nr:hypothetical protein [Bacteroides zhangwenhongii]
MTIDDKAKMFLEQIQRRLKQFNIPHQVMESKCDQSKSAVPMPFKCNYMIAMYLQNNNLGHQDTYIYLNAIGDTYSLVAVRTSRTTNTLINISNQLGMLYGVPFKRLEKVQGEVENYYFIF